MRTDDFNHDGYMTRMVSRAIFMCQTFNTKERRAELFKLAVRDAKQCEDLKEVLKVVFEMLKTNSSNPYSNDMWPTIEMVRDQIVIDDVNFENCTDASVIDIRTRKKLYA